MRKLIFLLLILLAGGVWAGTATLEVGTQIGSSGGTEYYTIYMWQANYTQMNIDSTNISFSGLNTNSEVFGTVQGLLCHDSTTCDNIGYIDAAENIIIHDFVSNTSSVTILSMIGNLSNMTICYNSTGQDNFTVTMEDQGDDCNYGSFDASGNTSNIYQVWFDRALTAFTECDITAQTNSTTQTEVCIHFYEDESMSETTLNTLLSALGITAVLISKGHQWDTVS